MSTNKWNRLIAALMVGSGTAVVLAQHTTQPAANTPDAKTIEAFDKRVRAVIDLRDTLEAKAPKLPQDSTPQQINAHQRSLEEQLRKARASAKPGELFTPDVQNYIRRVMADLLSRPEGRQLKSSILDENPVGITVKVNDRYPDSVPLSTMPPQLLKAFPPILEELEYRFVGNTLVLFDTKAHLILDLMPGVFPK